MGFNKNEYSGWHVNQHEAGGSQWTIFDMWLQILGVELSRANYATAYGSTMAFYDAVII